MTDKITTKPELQFHRIKEVQRQTSTLEQILGEERPGIEDPLGLLTAVVDVRIFESSHDLFYRVNFPNTALYGQGLIKLLTYATRNPSPSGAQVIAGIRRAILADWTLLNSKDKESIKRVESHKMAYDPYWTEFVEQHRIAFMNAVDVLSQEDIRDLFSTQAGKLMSMEQAVSELHTLVGGNEILLKHSLWIKYESLESWLKDTQRSITRENLSGLLGGKDVISDEYRKSLISELPPHLRRILVNDGILSWHRNVVDVQGMARRVKIGGCGLDGPKHEYSIHYHGKGNIEITDGSSWMKLHFEDSAFKETDSYFVSSNDNALAPSMLWSKDSNGQRNYLSSNIPTQLLQGNSKNANTLLGLIAATYLSPEQRNHLDITRGYNDKVDTYNMQKEPVGYQQHMGEAMIPLLVLMCNKFILDNSPLFPRVEALYST